MKGRFFIGKPPDEIYKTHHGFHIVYRNLDISEKKSLELRKKIGDDKNRIRLDMESEKKPKQILFQEKTVRYLDKNGMVEKEFHYQRERLK